MLIDHIIGEICNLMIQEIILISDKITLLDYGYQFIDSLHIVDKSWIRALSVSLLFT